MTVETEIKTDSEETIIDFAIIGGTGIYDWPGLKISDTKTIETPYGAPSAPIILGQWHNKRVAFLPRHGNEHTIPPHAINYRANLWALKSLNVSAIIALNAVGGIEAKTLQAPYLVIPDQAIDYTHGRAASYFHEAGDALSHIDFTDPYHPELRARLIEAAKESGYPFSSTGTMACTQGPRLETRAEIARLERDGCDIVGMTSLPETALAAELAIPYASLSIVVNPAAGKTDTLITLGDIKVAMTQGIQQARHLLERLITME